MCIQLGSFEAGSQLRTLQYVSTKALHLHLKGFDNNERELFVLLCHDIDEEDLFSFFAQRHTQELFASKQARRDFKRNFFFLHFRMYMCQGRASFFF